MSDHFYTVVLCDLPFILLSVFLAFGFMPLSCPMDSTIPVCKYAHDCTVSARTNGIHETWHLVASRRSSISQE